MRKVRTGDWLVLVLERFDESLQILREAYGWDMVDILYMSMKTTRTTHKTPLGAADRTALLGLSPCDTKLYQESLAVFERRVEEYGKERMAADVATFKALNAKANTICASKAGQVSVIISVTQQNAQPTASPATLLFMDTITHHARVLANYTCAVK